MPTIKEILTQQVAPIMALESKLPSFAPKISRAMVNVAQAMPGINLPDLPGKPNAAIPSAVSGLIGKLPSLQGSPKTTSPTALGYRSTGGDRPLPISPNGGYRGS